MSARTFRKLPDDVLLALSKLEALTDILHSMPGGHKEELLDHTVTTLAGMALDLVHEVTYESEAR